MNEIGAEDAEVDYLLETFFEWSYSTRWWYCYVVVLMFGVASFIGIIFASKITTDSKSIDFFYLLRKIFSFGGK